MLFFIFVEDEVTARYHFPSFWKNFFSVLWSTRLLAMNFFILKCFEFNTSILKDSLMDIELLIIVFFFHFLNMSFQQLLASIVSFEILPINLTIVHLYEVCNFFLSWFFQDLFF